MASARAAERARIVLACAEGASNGRVAAVCGVTWATAGRPKSELVLGEAERAELTRWARRAKTAQFLALRARIVLRCAQGGTNEQIAAELGIAPGTVNRWRSRFIRLRLDGLTDEPRPGRPPSILLDQVEDVLKATLESTPGKDTHWSRASMARHSGLSKSTIGRIWRKFDLKPHLTDGFKLSTEPSPVGLRRDHAQDPGHRHGRPAHAHAHIVVTQGDSYRLAQATSGQGVKPFT